MVARDALPSRLRWVVGLGLVTSPLALGAGADEPSLRIPPVEPAAAEKTFHTLDGFHMDLIAAEPLVTDPVAMAYDERGRAWVAEMNDYPYTDKANDVAQAERTTDKPLGKVRILEDSDGDGVFDRSSVLADLSWPTGIASTTVVATSRRRPTCGISRIPTAMERLTCTASVHRVSQIQCAGGDQQPGLGAGRQDLWRAASNGGQIKTVARPDVKPILLWRRRFLLQSRKEEFELLASSTVRQLFRRLGAAIYLYHSQPRSMSCWLLATFNAQSRICRWPRRCKTWPNRAMRLRSFAAVRPSRGGCSMPSVWPRRETGGLRAARRQPRDLSLGRPALRSMAARPIPSAIATTCS